MFHVVTFLFLLVVPQLIIAITISPDVGLRNISIKNPLENKTIEDLNLNSLTDRNRRLIPYMTFYIPQNEYPINQDYIPNPQEPQQQHLEEHETNPSEHHQSQSTQNEQNQMITIYQSSPSPPLNRLQHQSQQQQYHQQSQHNQYPDSIIENQSSSITSAGQPTAGGATFIPLQFENHRGQIYPQILYQDHGQNQLPLLKLKGNIPLNHEHHRHHQFPQQVHHSQQQHIIEGRLLVKENTLSKTKQQKQQPAAVVHLYHPEQQLTKTNLNSSPFTLFNKIPGHFTPIIYTNQGNNINYHENSQQYNDLVNGGGSSTAVIINSNENDGIEQAHKQEEHIYQIQQQHQTQQHQLNKQQQQYYQYHLNHYPHSQQQQQQQQQSEGNKNEQGVVLSASGEKPQQQQQHQSQQLQQHHQTNIGIVSSTQRPHFHIVTESPRQSVAQKTHYTSETIYHKKPEIESTELSSQTTGEVSLSSNILTPQQKYVAYLQRQYRNKQQTRNQHHQQQQQKQQQETGNYNHQFDGEAYIINASPLPSIAPPENHITYQKTHSSPQQHHHHRHHQYIYRNQPTKIDNNQEKEIVYIQEDERNDRPSISDTVQQTNHQYPQNHNYVEYINVPEEHHEAPSQAPQISSTISPPTTSAHRIPQKDNNNNNNNNIFKPIVFVTTAATPLLVTSVSSNYKQHHQYQQTQRLHPIVNPTNLSEKPILNNSTTKFHDTTIHHYNPQINQHKTPIYIVKPKINKSNQKQQQQQQIQPIRQHLTETTQLPSPVLTSYNPVLSNNRNNNNRHYYNNRYYHKSSTTLPLSSTSSNIPLKLKPSQKFKPIVVTTVRPTINLLNHGSEETSSIPQIPKYEKQSIDFHRQPEIRPIKVNQQQQTSHNSDTINNYPDIKSNSLAEILRKLQDSNHLPQTITPNNIDNSIKTLIKILNNLKETQSINENPPQHHDDDYRDYDDTPVDNPDPSHRGPNSGRPGIDYPALYEIPQTTFNCKEQRYKGFFGDPETNCQVWHYCDLNGGQASFLCPNGTIFSQVALTCDWWFNVKCSSTAQLYVLNERLYKYILPFTPKFPEDYSGPLVDKYLALKFKEMEEKMTREKLKGREKSEEGDENDSKTKDADDEELKEDRNKTNNNDDEDEISKEIDERSNATENQEIKSINLEDVEENRGSVDTGITYNTISTSTEYSLTLKPIVVSSTTIDPPIIYQSPQPTPFMIQSSTLRPQQESQQNHYKKPLVSVESEQLELIEIKTDGSSGHLVPSNSEYSN